MMDMRSLLLGSLLGLGLSAPALAQETIDGNSVEQVLAIAQGHGNAKLSSSSNGDPRIVGLIDGVRYVVYFMDCIENTNCASISLYTGFEDIKPAFEVINEWNATKRFGTAFIDNLGDANLEWNISLEFGVTPENLDASFVRWGQVIDEFSRYLGWR